MPGGKTVAWLLIPKALDTLDSVGKQGVFSLIFGNGFVGQIVKGLNWPLLEGSPEGIA